MRTSSEPARASAATWRAVPSASAVSVLVIDCTTIGAPPPTTTAPTRTGTPCLRAAAPKAAASPGTTGLFIMQSFAVVSRPRFYFLAGVAKAGDLQHPPPRAEADAARGLRKIPSERARRHLCDALTPLAQKEEDDIGRVMPMDAGKKRILAFDAVGKTLGQEKIERAINRHRRDRLPRLFQPLDDLIGPERRMAFRQRLQDPAAQRGELDPVRVTGLLGARERLGDAALVVVIEGWKANIHRHLTGVLLLHHIAR